MNEKEILKILQNIQKIESESDAEDSLLEKINRSITLNSNICGVGPNINEMIKLYLDRKSDDPDISQFFTSPHPLSQTLHSSS